MDEVYVGVKNWWVFLVRGVLAIAFGIILLAWPESTIRVLAYLVGILALLDGIIETVWAVVLLFQKEKMAMLLVRGLVGLIIGILLLAKTGFALAVVVVVIAVWAIIAGFVEVIASLDMPPRTGRGWLAFGGILSIILGVILLALPLETVYAIIVIFSIFLLISGVVHVVLAFYARKFEKELVEP